MTPQISILFEEVNKRPTTVEGSSSISTGDSSSSSDTEQSVPSSSAAPATVKTTTVQNTNGDADAIPVVPSDNNAGGGGGANPSRVVIAGGQISGGIKIPGSSQSIGVIPEYVGRNPKLTRPSIGQRTRKEMFCALF